VARRKNPYKLFLAKGSHWAEKSLRVLYRYAAEFHFRKIKVDHNKDSKRVDDTLGRLNFFLDFVTSFGMYFLIFAIRKRAEINKTEVHPEKLFVFQFIDEEILDQVMKEHYNERKGKVTTRQSRKSRQSNYEGARQEHGISK